jgi:hypothetical protein
MCGTTGLLAFICLTRPRGVGRMWVEKTIHETTRKALLVIFRAVSWIVFYG